MAIYGATTGVLRGPSSNSNSPSGGGGGIGGGGGGPGGLGLNNHNLAGLNLGTSLSMAHGHNPSSLLVVPQPINASKMGGPLGPGTGRKYQCKMCPQVINISNRSPLIYQPTNTLPHSIDYDPTAKNTHMAACHHSRRPLRIILHSPTYSITSYSRTKWTLCGSPFMYHFIAGCTTLWSFSGGPCNFPALFAYPFEGYLHRKPPPLSI